MSLRHHVKTSMPKLNMETDFHNTPFQNVKRVFRSCVGKITKKPTKKKSTKKASDSQAAKKVQQMFENELLSTIDDQGEWFICTMCYVLCVIVRAH